MIFGLCNLWGLTVFLLIVFIILFHSFVQVSHVIDKDGIHFLIYSTEPIAKGCEVTIPFDYNYKEW